VRENLRGYWAQIHTEHVKMNKLLGFFTILIYSILFSNKVRKTDKKAHFGGFSSSKTTDTKHLVGEFRHTFI